MHHKLHKCTADDQILVRVYVNFWGFIYEFVHVVKRENPE